MYLVYDVADLVQRVRVVIVLLLHWEKSFVSKIVNLFSWNSLSGVPGSQRR